MAFHGKLKELRERAGLTQDALAERAGLSKAGIANLEQARTSPAWETVRKLAAALGVSCEEFDEPAASDAPAPRGRPRKATEPPADAGPKTKPARQRSKSK